MKYSTVPLLLVLGVLYTAVNADETHKTYAQLLANGEVPDALGARGQPQSEKHGHDERYLVSPGPPFLCVNGDPLHNASRWEYFEECTDVDTCEVTFGGYSAVGPWCGGPKNPNKCCVMSLCAAPYDSTQYACVDVEKWPYCSEIVGGKELCPGPESVRCCS
ncbi:hypothetical protein M406DRAFT_349531 [Cryphonectria parasitica EP155]|uniref:Uncharacterized protein n=1 Tax=Cryphonectria parasitica (strain ATCC 38755 / EP155) TaxID=660469 RepID=A0A9P5CTW1_CRYP1|nr:uncharacterized protein M406DRAFT_349531 [Cryphonectria parasitica EP155]KAF3771064.1 hypothetical protein M406DRAFT_349531 [Cryphonectria parasitica EP155]